MKSVYNDKLKKMKKQIILLALVLMSSYSIINAQCVFEEDTSSSSTAKATSEAKNGWYITTSGTIRVLVIYMEIDYDNPANSFNDPMPNGTAIWAKNQLPTYKDNLFDLNWTGNPQAMVTKYFAESSFNNFKVLGDYVNQIITIKESDLPSFNSSNAWKNAFLQIDALSSLNTFGGSTIQDLDMWKHKTIAGEVNVAGPDTPYSYDHVVLVFRNFLDGLISEGNGYTGQGLQGNAGFLRGYKTDSYTCFTAGNIVPFIVFRHEFSHNLFGGNNFHTSGAVLNNGTTFIPNQKGWSMMTGYESSFLTCNAWDRDRMDWKGPGKTLNISAMNTIATEINGDLDATNPTHAGVYVLRDFVTTGDALRIKLPFIPSPEYQEYIWIENHQTDVNNGSDFDHFNYEYSHSCMDNSTPGLNMYLQAGKDIKTGIATYDQRGNYLRPIPADGMYDLQFENTLQQNFCVSWGYWFYPFEKLTQFANPLTGSIDLENPANDNNNNDIIRMGEGKELYIEKIGSQYYKNLPFLGHSRHTFRLNGINKIGVGTNPSANSMLTLEYITQSLLEPLKQNRAVRLNGVSVTILEELLDGSIKVKVDFDKTDVENDVRWAGNIELPAISGSNGYSLNLKTTKTINIDQGYTATKIDNPMTINGEKYFVDNTVFTALSSSYFHLESNATVNVINGSTLKLTNGSKMELEAGATLHIAANSSLIVENGAELNLKPGANLIIDQGATLNYKNSTANKGLLVGATTYTGNPAKVEVSGHISFASGAKWEHYRDGFYKFYPTTTLFFNYPSQVIFTGKGKTRKFIELANNTTLSVANATVNWNSGLIHYGSNAKIVLDNVTFTSINATYNPATNPQTTSTAVELYNPQATFFNSCDFNKLGKGVVVDGGTSLVHIQTGKFTNMTTYGVKLNNTGNFKMTNGFIDGAATCLYAENSNSTSTILEINGTELKNATYGAELYAVAGAYFSSNANIHNHTVGIKASMSLVFLRNGARVHTTSLYGVEIYGSYDSGLGSYNAMLTMGDIGCGSVYNNSNYGIFGIDALLNIDAVQHSIDRGDNIIRPNRFDNNAYMTFEMCYGSSTVAPSQINAKGNFWGVSPADIQPNQYTFVANVCAASGGTPVNIPLIHTDYSTCVPANSCMDCSSGGGGGSSSSSSSTTSLAVQTSFVDANTQFVAEDNTSTRNEFANLSAVELIKDTILDTWKGKSVNDVLFSLEKESVHLIQVSKAIKAGANNSTGRLMNIVGDVFKDVQPENLGSTSTVTLYPNPTNDKLFVDIEKEGTYVLIIYNISSQKVVEQILTDKHNLVNLNKLPDGMYFYELSAPNSNTVKGNITVTK